MNELTQEDKELWSEAIKRIREIEDEMRKKIEKAVSEIQKEAQQETDATLKVILNVFDRRYRLTERKLRLTENGELVSIQEQ